MGRTPAGSKREPAGVHPPARRGGEFTAVRAQPLGQRPELEPGAPETLDAVEVMAATDGRHA
jgi:hypothetical protein